MVWLLSLSLVIIPLMGTISIIPMVNVKDLWETKDLLVLLAIVGIWLMPVPMRQKDPNPWLNAMLVFLVLALFMLPPVRLLLGSADLGGSWAWKSMAWVFVYYILYTKIVCMPVLHFNQKEMIARAIGYAAVISSLYAIIQALGLDQFQAIYTPKNFGVRKAGEITAMIGNPTYLGIWLVMCLPFCLYAMKKWQIGVVMVAILLCQSDTATAGMIGSLVLMGLIRARSVKFLKVIPIVVLVAVIALYSSWGRIQAFAENKASGRIAVWKDTLKDWREPAILLKVSDDMPEAQRDEAQLLNKRVYSLTGRGLGSFEFFFIKKHPEHKGWNDPHSVFLRTLYEVGLIGLVLLLGMLGYVFVKTFKQTFEDEWVRCLWIALFFICFSALTMPMLILEPVRYFSVAVFCLLSAQIRNKIILK